MIQKDLQTAYFLMNIDVSLKNVSKEKILQKQMKKPQTYQTSRYYNQETHQVKNLQDKWCFCFLLALHSGVLVPQPGTEPKPQQWKWLVVKMQSPNHWTARSSSKWRLKNSPDSFVCLKISILSWPWCQFREHFIVRQSDFNAAITSMGFTIPILCFL